MISPYQYFITPLLTMLAAKPDISKYNAQVTFCANVGCKSEDEQSLETSLEDV